MTRPPRPTPTPPDALTKILDTISPKAAPRAPRKRPGESEPPKRVIGRRAPARPLGPEWENVWKNCPAPIHTGANPLPVAEFGVVVRRGVVGPTGWCKRCRSAMNYHALP